MVFQTDEDHIRANDFVRIDSSRRSANIQYDPFIRGRNPRREKDYYDDFDEITKIAGHYGRTNTQLITRWSLQHRVITTVKGLLPEKMISDFDVFDFYCLDRSKYEFNSCHYWSHADFPSYDTDCWTGVWFSYF